jgi:hypothetical protein
MDPICYTRTTSSAQLFSVGSLQISKVLLGGRAVRIYQHTVLDAYQHIALGLVQNINPEETTSCGLTLA